MAHAIINERKGHAYSHLEGVQIGAVTMEISMEVPQQAGNRSTT